MLELGEEAAKKNLKVGVGLMCRHCEARGRTVQAHQGRGDRRHRSCCGPIACTRPSTVRSSAPKPHGHERAALPDSQLPRVPVGQRRLLQRFPHPQHRRMLLDEGRLARSRPRRSAAGTTAATASIRTSTVTRSSTRSPTAPSCCSKAATCRAADSEFASYAHGTKGSAIISTNGALPGPVPHLQGPELRPRTRRSGRIRPATSRIPYQVEWDDLIDAIRQDKPYNEVEARRRGQPGDGDGPHGVPHRPDRHLRRDAQLRARVRARSRQADDGFARTGASRSRRQISRAPCRASRSIANIDACLLKTVPTAGGDQTRRLSGFCVLASEQLRQLPR